MGAGGVFALCMGAGLLRFVEEHQIVRQSSVPHRHTAISSYSNLHGQIVDIRRRRNRNEIFLQAKMVFTGRGKRKYFLSLLIL